MVRRFNALITARDLTGLGALMSEDHTFVDPAGTVVSGRRACLEAWRGFFAAFPGYRNVFESVTADHEVVSAAGHSECSDPRLAGPARWAATVHEGKVTRWHVYGDPATPSGMSGKSGTPGTSGTSGTSGKDTPPNS
ncbi:nuclear transport factor 2 family protein [Streptomyces sp. NPDC048603]|uniref:nuclear transport factor 2 family protein n=1 Tax=Streptomyces sp. NPDC048603 TaxID=3365577 RepID=UPI00371C3463